MSKLKPSEGQKKRYASYNLLGKYSKNKKTKLERHLKKHPNDQQASEATKNVKMYSRKKPNNKLGWVTEAVKTTLTFVPYLSPKGIVHLKSSELLAEVLNKQGQALTGTKDRVVKTAIFNRFIKKSSFNKTLDKDGKWVHTSKLSNFTLKSE